MVFKCQCPAVEEVLNEVGCDPVTFSKVMDFEDPVFIFENAECWASTRFKKWVKVGQPMAVHDRSGLGRLLCIRNKNETISFSL